MTAITGRRDAKFCTGRQDHPHRHRPEPRSTRTIKVDIPIIGRRSTACWSEMLATRGNQSQVEAPNASSRWPAGGSRSMNGAGSNRCQFPCDKRDGSIIKPQYRLSRRCAKLTKDRDTYITTGGRPASDVGRPVLRVRQAEPLDERRAASARWAYGLPAAIGVQLGFPDVWWSILPGKRQYPDEHPGTVAPRLQYRLAGEDRQS